MGQSTSIDDTAAAPWPDLQPELCGHVVDRLDAFSALRFPAVCKSWAAACEGAPRRLRSGAPTVLTSAVDGDRAATFALNDVSSGKSFYAEAEGLRNRWWVGAKDDWLVTMDAGFDVELLNPATGDVVRLPSFSTVPRAIIEDDVLCVAPRSVYRFQQVALCRTPAHRNGYLAIAMFGNLLAFTAAGDDCWTALRNHPKGLLAYEDTIAHEGKIFAVNYFSGHVYSWNMNSAANYPQVVRAPEIQSCLLWFQRRFNLATSISGRLLLVCTYGDRRRGAPTSSLGDDRLPVSHIMGNGMVVVHTEPPSIDARGVLLHELDAGGGAWRRVADLGGDRALFVGRSYPFYAAATHGCSGVEANSVYTTDLSEHAVLGLRQGCAGGGFEPLVHPNAGRSLRRPIWFRPTADLRGQVHVDSPDRSGS